MTASDVSVLFRSRTQLSLLSLLYRDPGREWPLTELVRQTGIPQPTVSREVVRMHRDGLAISERRQGRRYVQADGTCPIFTELRALVLYQTTLKPRPDSRAMSKSL